MITHDEITNQQDKEQLRQFAHDLLTTLGEEQHALNSLRSTTRTRQGATWELTRKIAEEYKHHADLAAYATGRYNGEFEAEWGSQDHLWWTVLMDECVAKRDALAQVVKDARTLLGFGIPLPPTDAYRGMEIYLQQFVLEGLTPAEQVDALTRMITGHLYDDDENVVEGVLAKAGKPASLEERTNTALREWKAGLPPVEQAFENVPPPEECFPDFPFASACKLYILKTYGEVLPNVKEDYIDEAEHQDGEEYWAEHFQRDDGSIDKEAIASEMVLYALNASPTDGDTISPAIDMSP